MKKLTLLCTPAQQEQTLEKLRDLKVVHVEHVLAPEGHELDKARNHLLYVQRAREVLTARPDTDPTGKDPDQLVDKVWELLHKEKELKETLQALEHEHTRIAPFGEFDPRQLNKLNQSGIVVAKLYEFSTKDEPEIPEGVSISEINRDKNNVYVLAVSREDFTLPAHEVRIPDQSHSDLHRHIEKTRKTLEETEAEFQKYAGDKQLADEIADHAADSVNYLEVREGMGSEEAIVYLQGFYPAERESDIEQAAAEQGWGYTFEEVGADEDPPTLLRNPKWVSPIKAALDLIDVVPGYRELDVSALFLIFLSIFFAFIVGDGGYGLLFLGLTIFGKIKSRGNRAAQPGLNLMLIMSAATIVFGSLTGNYFGIPTEKLPDFMQNMANPYMTGLVGDVRDSDLAANHIMFICFSIAVVHLSIAHLWNIIRKINSSAALVDLGWLFCTWSLYTIVLELVLDVQLYAQVKPIQIPLLAAGAVTVALGLLLTKAYIGIITLFLDVISNFVDIISYIRLYAVGAASLAVAQAFNEMALGDNLDGKWTIGAILILFAGHALNIVLAAMGVMVHGIRLNTLEFSGHAGVEWAGIHYNPFKKTEK